jgi:SAM-dependent methyltransferase
LTTLSAAQFDAVYCAHNLEHYYRHEVPRVLAGFCHVLKPDGFVHIRVPDLGEVMKVAVARVLDIEDVLYQSPAGPIMVLDVLYGFSVEIERSGQDFFAHKTGFTTRSLLRVLQSCGFPITFSAPANFEISVLAFPSPPTPFVRTLFALPPEKV